MPHLNAPYYSVVGPGPRVRAEVLFYAHLNAPYYSSVGPIMVLWLPYPYYYSKGALLFYYSR